MNGRIIASVQPWAWSRLFVALGGVLLSAPPIAYADVFEAYTLIGSLQLPAGAAAFDVLNDGRVITIVGEDIYLESNPASGTFGLRGSLPMADIASLGAAFLRVSPNGMNIAVGNNGGASYGNFEVGVFDLASLTGVWFTAEHFDAEWLSNSRLAITAGDFTSGVVTVLDITSPDPLNPTNPVVIENIGGASGGVTFDDADNLYTGNGFMSGGPSGTGAVKVFDHALWAAALNKGTPLDFETSGTLVVDILSASSVGFDIEGNLHVAGGDFNVPKIDFVALVRSSAVQAAINGSGPADIEDPTQVRRLDPDTSNNFNFYSATYTLVLRRLYLRSFGDSTVYIYADPTIPVPTVSEWGLLMLSLLLLIAAKVVFGRRQASHTRFVSVALVTMASTGTAMADSPFVTTVIEFAPAPGQFVNDSNFNDPSKALGPPSGGGTVAADNSSIVSLGGFGGRIVLGFDHTVQDDPRNPLGMDAIVFGNAVWVGGDPDRHFAECATIEIALDVNHNGQADDPWYLIPGTHITDPDGQFTSQTWDDNIADPTFPPSSSSWIPPGQSGTWTTEGYLLPGEVFAPPGPPFQVVVNPNEGEGIEGIYGYAEYAPSLILGDMDADDVVDDAKIPPDVFYVVPDDPLTVGMTPGAGGGDAFDIAWAVDPATGLPANLPGFDFIRLTNGANAIQGPLGEVSPEIDAVSDVAPVGGETNVPTVSHWGMIVLILLVTTAGTMIFRISPPRSESGCPTACGGGLMGMTLSGAAIIRPPAQGPGHPSQARSSIGR